MKKKWLEDIEKRFGVGAVEGFRTEIAPNLWVSPLYDEPSPQNPAFGMGAQHTEFLAHVGDGVLDLTTFHNQGGHVLLEVACIFYELSKLADRKSPRVAIALETDPLLAIAKLRAVQGGWARMQQALGREVSPLEIIGVVSKRNFTVRAPWVNPLRTTTQVFAALVCRISAVVVPAHDELTGAGDSSKRLSENTFNVLREESHLQDVVDPAAGSFFLESLTWELAREGWKTFQEITTAGNLETWGLSAKLAHSRAWFKKKLDDGDLHLIGTTLFQQEETTLPYVQDSTVFRLEEQVAP